MAADVSTLVRAMNGSLYSRDDRTAGNESSSPSSGVKSATLITRDLLGGCGGGGVTMKNHHHRHELQELDLDSHVPIGWEKRLDLKSGKVYLQRCDASNSHTRSLGYQRQTDQTVAKTTLNLFEDGNLELKLVSSSSTTPTSQSSKSPSNYYQSVCTLDKVKFALERAEREPIVRKRSALYKSSLSNNSCSSDSKEVQEEDQENDAPSPVAVGCPGCLSYVLVMKNNPKCPRCKSLVSMLVPKKPRLDLNISI